MILLPPDLVARRRSWVRKIAAALSVTIFMLGGGLVTYLAVNGAPDGGAAEVDESKRANSIDLLREPGTRKGGADAEEPGA